MDPRISELERDWRERNADRLDAGELGDRSLSDVEIDALYTPLSADPAARYTEDLGFPGQPPYTRGAVPGGYREKLWVMGQYSGRASPSETNRRIRDLLAKGQRGFSVALDLPTQNGLDSDHPLAHGEVGRVGVPIDTLDDMVELLDGIPLDEVAQIRTTANAIGPIAVAMFVAAAEVHGFKAGDFRVMLQNDVLKEYVARGTYVFPPRPAFGFAVDVVEYCARELPHWEPIEFCGYHLRDSGASAVQELALAMANGFAYIDAVIARGLDIDDFASSLFMFLSAHLDLFEEVAKFRAARRLWSRAMKDRYGARREESRRLQLFVYTLGSTLTAQEPLNNVVRVAYQALAAALGGVQTLATSSYDEAIGLPSDEAARLSLRTQQVLAYETGVTRSADPLGGSWLVEHLTDRLERDVLAYLERVAEQGGAVAALESGWIGEQLDAEAYRQQQAVESGERVVVGLNRFGGDAPEADLRPVTTDGRVEEEQVRRLAEVRRSRDGRRTRDALAQLHADAKAGRNTVPAVLEAVRAQASVGEICDTLADLWGRHDQRRR